jgi:hypothetical protein
MATDGLAVALLQYRVPTLTVPSWQERHLRVEPDQDCRLAG